jgi:TetR/AcrR family transcriptional regulator, acrAB operon repressor
VRRTKEEALATRSQIIDTAERVFNESGVSRTSLADIADAAGVTRGAIYWHFKNKADLFHAMIERVALPMEDMVRAAADESAEDPLERVRAACVYVLRRTATDRQARRVLEIAFFKCELDKDIQQLVGRQMECREQGMQMLQAAFRNAIRRGQLPKGVDPRRATIGLMALIDGLLYNWLLKPDMFPLAKDAAVFVDMYLSGLQAAGPAQKTAKAPGRGEIVALSSARKRMERAS